MGRKEISNVSNQNLSIKKNNMMEINGNRLWESLMEMAEIGATEKGGCRRLALTDLDRQGRDLFVSWCREIECGVEIDEMGNIFARKEGLNPDLLRFRLAVTLTLNPVAASSTGCMACSGPWRC